MFLPVFFWKISPSGPGLSGLGSSHGILEEMDKEFSKRWGNMDFLWKFILNFHKKFRPRASTLPELRGLVAVRLAKPCAVGGGCGLYSRSDGPNSLRKLSFKWFCKLALELSCKKNWTLIQILAILGIFFLKILILPCQFVKCSVSFSLSPEVLGSYDLDADGISSAAFRACAKAVLRCRVAVLRCMWLAFLLSETSFLAYFLYLNCNPCRPEMAKVYLEAWLKWAKIMGSYVSTP